jgi:type IV secretion system protein VirD4
VHRIVYFQDQTFRKLFEAQKGALPYPSKDGASVQVLTERLEALERRIGERMVVDFVRPEMGNVEAPVRPEPKLAAEIVEKEKKVIGDAKTAIGNADTSVKPQKPEAIESLDDHLNTLKPKPMIAISRINRFTQKVSELM